MREIKFRAWDVEMKHMVEWDELQEEWEQEGYYDSVFRGDHWVPMQYTGLKDLKGKEIYEGDIFIINKDDDEGYDIVIWDDVLARFELKRFRNPVTDISLLFAVKNKSCEVVGNIYEN